MRESMSNLRSLLLVRPAIIALSSIAVFVAITSIFEFRRFRLQQQDDSERLIHVIYGYIQVSGKGVDLVRSVNLLKGTFDSKDILVLDQNNAVLASTQRLIQGVKIDENELARLIPPDPHPAHPPIGRGHVWNGSLLISRDVTAVYNVNGISEARFYLVRDTSSMLYNWVESRCYLLAILLCIAGLCGLAVLYLIRTHVSRPAHTFSAALSGFGDGASIPDAVFREREWNDIYQNLRAIAGRIHAYQNDLIQARREAEMSAESRKTFLSTISHEMRTPLNGIIGMIDQLNDGTLDQRQSSLLQTIQSCSDFLLGIINDVLDFGKIEARHLELSLQPTAVRDIVNNAARLFVTINDKSNLTFSSSIDPRVPELLMLDPLRLQQIIVNLINNAYKFTAAGKVTLSVSLESETALVIVVEDTGVGISPEHFDRLFKPFSQVDGSISRKYGGSGLGLAICKELAKLMGGDIRVESTLGKGSRFTVRVLAKIAPTASLAAIPPRDATMPAASYILVAEDNEVNQAVVRGYLNKLGCRFVIVNNGHEAVERCLVEQFDIILMDIHMPELDGISAMRKIREQGKCRAAKIIAVTADANADTRDYYIQIGFDGFVAKPIRKAHLEEKLREAMKGAA